MKKERSILSTWLHVAHQECRHICKRPLYLMCMAVLPLCIILFFTNIMREGLPTNLPVGVVDLDNSATSRKLMRNLDAFQQTHIVAHYADVVEARRAMQRLEIYAYIYIPPGMESNMLAWRQPKISFYYNNATLLAGSLLYRDLRTISTLGNAAVGSKLMQAKGYTPRETKASLQPIVVDTHPLDNPLLNYNVALSTTIIPASILLFVFLMTCYTMGREIKFGHAKIWMRKAGNNMWLALSGKILPHTCVFSVVIWFYQLYLFGYLHFPHQLGIAYILLLGWLLVVAAQGFAIFIFAILPTLRMSMSICALWGVISFSISGFTFPLATMDPPIRLMSWCFPLRHYYMIYQMNILHGFPLYDSWPHVVALIIFALLPILVMHRLKTIFTEYEYLP